MTIETPPIEPIPVIDPDDEDNPLIWALVEEIFAMEDQE